MKGLLQKLRLAIAAAVLMGTLLALPLSMAWGASNSSAPAVAVRVAGWAQPLDKRINLYRMAPGLYRSALPKAQDWPQLEQLGVATVINFYQKSDEQWLRDPSVRQIQLPLHTDRIDDADVIEVMRSIRQAQAQGPVLIHCQPGQSRTGLIAAMHRIIYQEWSKEQALAEMAGAGFGGEDRMGDAERYIRDADVAALHGALQSGACAAPVSGR